MIKRPTAEGLVAALCCVVCLSCGDAGSENSLVFGSARDCPDPPAPPSCELVGPGDTFPTGTVWFHLQSSAEFGDRFVRIDACRAGGDCERTDFDFGFVPSHPPEVYGTILVLTLNRAGSYVVNASLVGRTTGLETFLVSAPLEITSR